MSPPGQLFGSSQSSSEALSAVPALALWKQSQLLTAAALVSSTYKLLEALIRAGAVPLCSSLALTVLCPLVATLFGFFSVFLFGIF